jgi:hypothetical protein
MRDLHALLQVMRTTAEARPEMVPARSRQGCGILNASPCLPRILLHGRTARTLAALEAGKSRWCCVERRPRIAAHVDRAFQRLAALALLSELKLVCHRRTGGGASVRLIGRRAIVIVPDRISTWFHCGGRVVVSTDNDA